jgi:hypothetical protein
MAFTLPYTPAPGPFYDVTFWLNAVCVVLIAVLFFVAINIAVAWVFALRNGATDADAPAPEPTRRERRRWR